MKDTKILELLREALAFADPETSAKIEAIPLDAKLSQLGVDSITALEMSAYVEEKLNIQFPDTELGLLADVKGFVELIKKYAVSKPMTEKEHEYLETSV